MDHWQLITQPQTTAQKGLMRIKTCEMRKDNSRTCVCRRDCSSSRADSGCLLHDTWKLGADRSPYKLWVNEGEHGGYWGAEWACRPLPTSTAENKDGRPVALTVINSASAQKQLYSDALLDLCIQHAKYYHWQFYLLIWRARCVLKHCLQTLGKYQLGLLTTCPSNLVGIPGSPCPKAMQEKGLCKS